MMKLNRTLRLAALLCLLLASAVLFAACGKHVPEDAVRLVDGGATAYRIVRSDDSSAGEKAALTLRNALDRITDESVKIITDFEHEKLGTVRTGEEILIGPTNREESKAGDLSYYDYDIRFETTRLAVTGGSDTALDNAVQYLLDNFYYKKDRAFALPAGFVYEYRYEYPLKSITIGGRELSEFSIVSAMSDTRVKALADSFLPVYGKAPKCITPHASGRTDCEIVLSSAKDEKYAGEFAALSDFEYMYKIEGTKVYIGSNGNSLDDAQALEMFISDCFGDLSYASGSLSLGDMTRIEKIPSADAFDATDEFLSSIDEKAEALKNAILTSENLEVPKDAVVYYVSESGSDENDGKSPEKAWQTLDKVNNFEFDPEKPSYVLFERGGIWRGQIGAQANVTYSAYGEGEKPCLYGSPEDGADPALWSLLEGTENVWVYAHEMMDSGTLVFNGGEKVAYKEIPSYVGGRYVKRDDPETPFDLIEALDNDLDFFHAADSLVSNDMPQVGNVQCVGEIYLRCDEGNPGEVFESIEFLPRRNGFGLKGDNVTINNFTIKYVGAHGIGGGSRTGITVSDCEIGWIGGGIQGYNANGDTNHRATRYGNGVEIYVSCKDFTVDHCYIYEVYDAAVTHQYKGDHDGPVTMKNVEYSNNLIENCVYSVEYFLAQNNEPYQLMSDIRIHDNIMRFAGFGWGEQRPNKNGEAHIKGWDHANPAWDFRIYDNIFDRSSNWMVHCGFTDEQDTPLFENNTFIQYEDGSFGKYRTVPTGDPVPYGTAMLTDERLMDNDFYFIRKE